MRVDFAEDTFELGAERDTRDAHEIKNEIATGKASRSELACVMGKLTWQFFFSGPSARSQIGARGVG